MSKDQNKKPKQVKHKNARYADKVEIIAYLPMIIAFGYVPLIVRGYIYEIPPIISEQPWGPQGAIVDFFLAYKSFAIIVMGLLSVIMVLASLPQKPFRWNKIFSPLAVYVVMVVLSAIISPYRYLAFAGSMEMFESVFVILSYVAIFIAIYHFVSYDGMAGIKVFLYGSIPGIFIMLSISLFQFLKMDIFRTEFGKSLIMSQELRDQLGDISFTFAPGTVYATLYNTNFLGFYTAIVSSLFFGLIFAAEKVWEKVVCVIGLILSIICMFGSKTTTSWLVLVFMIALGILIWAFREKKRGFIILGCYGLIGVIGIVMLFSDTTIGTKVRKTLGVGPESNVEMIVKGIDTNENGIDFTLNTGGVHIEYEPLEEGGIELYCTDDEGKALEVLAVSEDKTSYEIALPEDSYKDSFTIGYNTDEDCIIVYLGMRFYGDDIDWKFTKDKETSGYFYVANNNLKMSINTINKYIEFFPNSLMSSRGPIWNYTIPMLPRHIILGSGANTYIMEYPQNDYITERLGYDPRSLDVKPHSFYLQQWVENGLVSIIALLAFFGWYIYRVAALLYKSGSWKGGLMLNLGCLLGVGGWMFSGIANDSNVCTSMPFWCLLAVGFAINEYTINVDTQKD